MECSRDKELWTKIKSPIIQQDRYIISTNGRIKDLITNTEVKHVRRRTSITTFVGLYKADGGYSPVFNLQRLMINSFTKLNLTPDIKFYFKNGDIYDLFIGNIGIRRHFVVQVDLETRHEICKLMQDKVPLEEIVYMYRRYEPTMIRNLMSLMSRGYYSDITSNYDIDMDLYNRIR